MPPEPDSGYVTLDSIHRPAWEERSIATNRGRFIRCMITGDAIVALETIPGVVERGTHLEVNDRGEVVESRNPPTGVAQAVAMAASGVFSREEMQDAMRVPEGLIQPPGRMETRAQMLERTFRYQVVSASGSAPMRAGTASWYPDSYMGPGTINPDTFRPNIMEDLFNGYHPSTGYPVAGPTIPEPPTGKEFQDPPETFEERTREDMIIMEDGLVTKTLRKLKLRFKHAHEETRDVIIDE